VEDYHALIKKSLLIVLFNNNVTTILYMFTVTYLSNWKFPFSFHPDDIPGPWDLFKQIVIFIIAEDFWFYFMHRIMHIKHKYFPMYQWVHKWHHEHQRTVSISNQVFHPIEFILVPSSSLFFGMMFLGSKCHYTTTVIWYFIRILEAHDAHSGYDFPWNPLKLLPFGSGPAYHDFHHSANSGCYATFFTVWDTLLDTNGDFYK
jgi:sterol desaturase/sphingolipid hydroxylase (fatty acid hydroxylase superfamily)